MNEILERYPDPNELKNIKILIQEPGKSNIIREIVSLLDDALLPIIKNTGSNNNNFRRHNHIFKKILYIVESIPIHCIWIRNSMTQQYMGTYRIYGQDASNVAFPTVSGQDIMTFDYWGLPTGSFQVLFSDNPMRTEYLTHDAIILPIN